MIKPKPTATSSNPLDEHWRELVSCLNTVLGFRGPYVDLHDALIIEKFCEEFDVPLSAVSERLETFCHSPAEGLN
jgi:hypothetical protein